MSQGAERREIDLAARATNRAAAALRLVLRLLEIGLWLGVVTVALPIFCLTRRSARGGLGAALAFLFQRLGATFIKIGQIMSARPDVFSPEFTAPLATLQDQVPPFPFAEVRRAIEEDFGRKLEEIFVEIGEKPVAAASIAQVHRASLADAELPPTFPSRVVAVKVRRPGIVRRAYLDEAILRFGARLLSWIPTFSLLSPLEAVVEFCDAVNKQLDFRIEAENNRRFRESFEDDPHLVFPALVDPLCSDRVLTMEFVHGVKASDTHVRAIGGDAVFLAHKFMEFASRMTYRHGLIHADLHPGNLLLLPGDRWAMIDVGLVAVLSPDDRRRFALFTYHVFSGKGAQAAKWLYEASDTKGVRDYDAYERDVHAFVGRIHDRPIEQVVLTAHLAELYAILRRHRLRLESTFTMPNVAMMVAEGIVRRLNPRMNLTREIAPHIESALALTIAGVPSDAVAESPIPTSIAGGRYRVRRVLGQGARKRVYLARDTLLARDVAVALIRTADLDGTARARITREARAVARLADHPRIVPVYDSGDEAGVPYVVSQYMAGGTLSARLLRSSDHRLPLADALRFADQLLQALEYAHGLGIVHRDVKPENVWLTEDGYAKLGDFGLAENAGGGDGATVGTALYMAPEQALGRRIDHRSDLYSFGATLHELLTGEPPFAGESVAQVVARHMSAVPEPPSSRADGIPPTLDAIVLRLLAKDPDDRFESAAAVRAALREVAEVSVPESIDDRTGDAARGVFVGRESEMALLRKALDEALAGRGRLVVLVGEPGIGKTRSAEVLASYARRRGGRVLAGRSFEGEGAPAFWPWVQILRRYLEGRERDRLVSELGTGAAYLAQIVPELRELVPSAIDLATEGEEARFHLFDAIAAFFKRAAASEPLVLLVDDLHCADKPSLLLLHFLTRELGGSRILIVGAYRDVDVLHGHPLAEILPALRRERSFERILLRGLAERDVRELLAALAGTEVPLAFARAIHRETEGNPFFIAETLRHLLEEGVVSTEGGRWTSRASPEEMGLPEGVREVIGRRLARLSDGCRRILATASALGRDFVAPVLKAVAGVEPEGLRHLLEEATAAQLVEEQEAGVRYRFSHALVRETLYAELGTADRTRCHRKIAEGLVELYGDDSEEHLSELAHHFLEASPTGDIERAIDLAVRAAERADRRFAYEEAAGFYRRALRALEASGRLDEGRECALLVELGTSEWRGGDFESARATVRRAAELAERAGRPDVLARAAVVYSGEELQTAFAALGQEMVPLLESALRLLPREDSSIRALVMGRLAGAISYWATDARRGTLFDEAKEMAKRVGDERALASVMMSELLAQWGAQPLEQVAENTLAFARLAERLRDERLQLAATALQGVLAGESGDLETADRWFAEAESLSVHHPHLRWFAVCLRAAWALAAAKPAEAERMLRRNNEFCSAADPRINLLISAMQRALNESLRGRAQDMEKLLPLLESTWLDLKGGAGHVKQITLWSMLQDHAASVPLLDVVGDLSRVPRDTFWLTQLSLGARLIEAAGAVELAPAVYEALLPFEGRAVISGGAFCLGSTSRYLALLAKVLCRFDDAERHFEAALQFERQMPLWRARTRYDYARTLRLRAQAGDRERALAELEEAIEEAEIYGVRQVAADATALKLELEGLASASPRSSIEALTASLGRKGVDVSHATAPNGTVTLLFTEIADFAELTEARGDAAAVAALRTHQTIVREELRAHHGATIEAQRDGFLLAFPKASEALAYAIAVQRALAAHGAEHPDERIRIRAGIHVGEPLREEGRFFGKTVMLAARIAARARADEILVSSLVHGLTQPAGEFSFDEGQEVALADFPGTQRIYGVIWNPTDPARRPAPPRRAPVLEENVFRREGDFWAIAYEGRAIRLKDAKGVQYLATLIRRAGQEVHVTELVNDPSGDSAALESLREDLGEAQTRNDLGRAELIRARIELGDRESSEDGDTTQRIARARKAVSSRLYASIARIREENPALGLHLANSVRVGYFCGYAPDRPLHWRL